MFRSLLYPALFALFACSCPARAAAAQGDAAEDVRRLVEMPAETRRMMQQEMISHLSTLHELIALLNAGNLDKAAATAEKQLGKSSMGKHRGTGKGPGRYMPMEMRTLGWSMHEAASELSQAAAAGDREKAYAALQEITAACVACHNGYRTQ